jgi:hypothetical protein
MGHGSLKVSDRNWIRGLYRRGLNDRELASLASFRFGAKGDAVKACREGRETKTIGAFVASRAEGPNGRPQIRRAYSSAG